jgi:SAM-dependent methyltransferase
MDISEYRASPQEEVRTNDLLSLVPRNRSSILDVGARDGHFSRLFTQYFEQVIALDLQQPQWHFPNVTTVAGDVTNLNFPDNSFDCVFCAEVLEHIPSLERACNELLRVARHEIIIGVPYKQDTRLGRTTCGVCGNSNPPWGHVNSFDEAKLLHLFSGARLHRKSFVGTTKDRTNAFATFLMKLGGDPWGTYQQEEPCIHCGAELVAPMNRGILRRVCSAVAGRINARLIASNEARPNWIHLLFTKDTPAGANGAP